MKFRKKPVEIEAVRVSEALKSAGTRWQSLPRWLEGAYDRGGVLFGNGFINIITSEGVMRGDYDDWIIRGVKGELYPCKPDIFAATYEPVEDSASPQQEEPHSPAGDAATNK
jgi:hypothetical protein